MLHNMKQVASGISLYIITENTEFMHFNQDGAISSLNVKPLKSIDLFKYFGNNISSTESDGNMCIGKIWIAVDRLLTI